MTPESVETSRNLIIINFIVKSISSTKQKSYLETEETVQCHVTEGNITGGQAIKNKRNGIFFFSKTHARKINLMKIMSEGKLNGLALLCS